MNIRTDLAFEIREEYLLQFAKENQGEPDGVKFKETVHGRVKVSQVEITNENGVKAIGKPIGKYITVFIGKVSMLDKDVFTTAADTVAEILGNLSGGENTLVIGLGNRYITADSVGSTTLKDIVVTRHLKTMEPEIFKRAGFSEVSTFVPGVLAQSGIQTDEAVKTAVKAVNPDRVIIIDSLVARGVETLGTTIQITDSGITPGSGIGNDRGELSEKTLGVKTVAIGVPMVIDAATLVRDLTETEFDSSKIGNFFVCPKDTDKEVGEISRIIAFGVNKACHKDMSYDDMAFL